MDDSLFSAAYRNGNAVALRTVFEGGAFGSGIYYLQGEIHDDNDYSESLSIRADDRMLYL